jgi:hypothetical protein
MELCSRIADPHVVNVAGNDKSAAMRRLGVALLKNLKWAQKESATEQPVLTSSVFSFLLTTRIKLAAPDKIREPTVVHDSQAS